MVHQPRGVGLPKSAASFWLVILLALTLAHCKGETASVPPAPPPQVEIAEVIQKDVPIFSEWVGTTDGLVNAEIRSNSSFFQNHAGYQANLTISSTYL